MSAARKRSRMNRYKAEIDAAQQLTVIARHHADVMKAAADHMARLGESMRAALLEAREFIAAERQTHVECSTHPVTHAMDPDDFDHAEDVTALLQRIDTALGGTPE